MKRLALLLLAAALAAAAPPPERPTLYLVGDSTMATRADSAPTLERGWGQMLARYLDGAVAVRNAAVNGRSTKSFIAEGRWAAVRDALRPGDYVLVEFGHNDAKLTDSSRYTNPYTGYRRNLARMVGEARARGATPVLLTPIARRHFNAAGTLEDTHGAYALVVREVARDERVPFVDLQLLTEELIAAAGPERSKALFVWVAPGASPFYPDGRQDDTHLNAEGASAVARLAARALRDAGLPLARHVVGVD
jgi:lysophospholipase L1-like esterase